MEITELREMLELDPDDVELRYVLGLHLLEDDDGDPKEAVTHLRAVLENDPRHVASHLALGQAYMRLGKEDEARETLEEGLRVAETLKHGEGRDLMPQFEELLGEL
jgi:cytochrome c-type biogenesis protein CcmH/NrfG